MHPVPAAALTQHLANRASCRRNCLGTMPRLACTAGVEQHPAAIGCIQNTLACTAIQPTLPAKTALHPRCSTCGVGVHTVASTDWCLSAGLLLSCTNPRAWSTACIAYDQLTPCLPYPLLISRPSSCCKIPPFILQLGPCEATQGIQDVHHHTMHEEKSLPSRPVKTRRA